MLQRPVVLGQAGQLASTPWMLGFAVLGMYTLRLGAMPLFDVDEGAFAEATREMLVSGDFGHTWLNGEDRFDKPILSYWLQALSVWILGVNPLAFRLPSAVAAALWCGAIVHFVQTRLGVPTARWAGLVAATSLGPLVIGRAATADAWLNLWLALALFDLWRAAESQRAGEATPWQALARASLWVGLGLLTKGPVAALVPMAVSGLGMLWLGRWRTWLRWAVHPSAWLPLIVVALPWYAYAWDRHGMAFIDGFFMRHNVARFADAMEGHAGGLGYFLVCMPALVLPWVPALLAGLRHLPATWRPLAGASQGFWRWMVAWAGFVLLFFSLSGTKLPHYALYGCTPLFIGVASVMQRAGPGLRRASVMWLLALLMGWSLLPLALLSLDDPWLRLVTGEAESPAWPTSMLQWGAVAAVLLWMWAGLREGGWAVPRQIAVGAVLWAALLVLAGAPWLAELLQGPIARAAQMAGSDRPLWQYRVHWPSVSVVRQALTPRGEPGPGEWAVTRSDRLPPWPYRVVWADRGVVLLERVR